MAVAESEASSKPSDHPRGWIAFGGPGIVYVLTVLGTGDLISNMAAGASYGYQLIWALGVTLIFRFVWVNTSAKYVLVTGESLLTGYGRAGRWVPWLVLIASFPIQHFTNQFLILIMGSSAHLLLPFPTAWSAPLWSCLFTVVGFAMMFWGGYPLVESFCKVLIGIMGGSLLMAALLSDPDPMAILKGAFLPRLPQAQGLYSAVLIIMALIGTEIGSTANLTYAYFIREKGWKDATHLKHQCYDLGIGVICLFFMGVLPQIAAAGTIHPLGVGVEDAEDLAGIFSATQGRLGLVLFSVGLWGAAFSTFVGVNMGCALVVRDICRSFVPGLRQPSVHPKEMPAAKNDPIYRGVILLWSFAPLYILTTGVSPVWLVLTVSAFVGFLVPVLVLALLKITNDGNLMREYRNGWWTNGLLVVLAGFATYFAYRNILGWWTQWA